MGARNKTIFSNLCSFTEILDLLDNTVRGKISAHIPYFEMAWRASNHDGELPPSFHAEQDKLITGPIQLYQLRVGPGNPRGYRAWVLFRDQYTVGEWIYLFKKVRGRQQDDMDYARKLASQRWEVIKRGK